MDPIKKFKNRKGSTLIEVLVVVALMMILLGIAMPNLIAESKQIKMTEMNANARAVAVAVQSKLYGMKSAGTSLTSSFGSLNADAKEREIITQDGADGPKTEKVKYVCNFGDETAEDSRYIAQGRTLLSGALTDATLLNKGKILVLYKPDTADVLEVFYSEDEFNVEDLLYLLTNNVPMATYLSQNEIGHYYGTGVDEPTRQEGMPLFSAKWIWDDELRLEVKMLTNPPEELLDTPLGLEIYLQFPRLDGGSGKEEILLYAEGIFGKDGYKVGQVQPVTYARGQIPYNVIQGDTPLTLKKIQEADNTLNFALDSMVTDHVDEIYTTNPDGPDVNSLARPWLRHNIAPDITNVLQDWLYPRESLAHWLDPKQNPYITVWFRRHAVAETGPNQGDDTISWDLYRAIVNAATGTPTPTTFVGVDELASLRVELYELETEDEAGVTPKEDGNHLRVRKADGRSVSISSNSIDPYYYLLTEAGNEVALSSMRDLSNLSYVFNGVSNNITKATLYGDITGDQHYEKLYDVRHKLIDVYSETIQKTKTLVGGTLPGGDIKEIWNYSRNTEQTAVASMSTTDEKSGFTLSGKKRDGSGSYKIQNINFGGADPSLGGLFRVAKGCTFQDLDIVNAHVWRRSVNAPFDATSTKDKINQVNAYDWSSGISGSLVGFALDCKFENVRNYLDKDHRLKVEYDNSGDCQPQPHTLIRVSGVVAGGLVGVAVGRDAETGTQFKNCSASTRVCTEPYFTKQRCLYAGGLIGIAMGKVEIESCYAASLLSGWYSGGLVGMTLSNALFEGYGFKPSSAEHAIDIKGTVNSTPTIKDSFAAGQIQRTVRVGGGLIAEKQGTVEVNHCYSAVWFETMPPVAYGTFEGDQKNFYVFQTKVSIPLTANVEALFTTDNRSDNKRGDILSKLQHDKGVYSGIPKTLAGIKREFADWGMATQETTHIWTWNNNNLSAEESYGNMTIYPFPMPYGNEFWGDWIKQNYYVENEAALEGPDNTAPIEFQGFYSVYYANGDGAVASLIDAGETIARTEPWWLQSGPPLGDPVPTNMFTISTIDGKKEVCLGQNTQVPKLDEDGNPVLGEDKQPIMEWKSNATPISQIRGGQYWAENNYPLGQGIDGATEITATEENGIEYFNFYSATFYDPNFDPIKGFQLKGTGITVGTLYWDYYGFYCCPLKPVEYTNNDSKKYYVEFADRSDLKGTEEDNIINAVLDEENQKVIVDGETFMTMLGYQTITLPYAAVPTGWNGGGLDNVTVEWNVKDGMLKIVENKNKG